jgi:hypothetical protein
MAKKKKAQPVIELTLEQEFENDYAALKEHLNGDISEPPYIFPVGTVVSCGNLSKTTVEQVLEDGRVYYLRYEEQLKNGLTKTVYTFRWWFEVRRLHKSDYTELRGKYKRLAYSQTNIDGLLHKFYYPGVDMNPAYQRDYVWEESDKVMLIDSVFQGRDIGKFVFVERDWEPELEHSNIVKMWEILDGKQRLRTLVDYFEDRFTYKGLYYSDLCLADVTHFRTFQISYAEVTDVTDRKQIIEMFLHLNRSGRVMDAEHLDKIEQQFLEKK